MAHSIDISISFAGEQRRGARKLAILLHAQYGLRVFYDEFKQAELLGEFLPEYLLNIFRDQSRFCAVFISKAYKIKKYPKHEWRAIQERAMGSNKSYLLPIQVDDTVLPGQLEAISYLPYRKLTIAEIASIIYSKMKHDLDLLNGIREAATLYKSGNFSEIIENLKSSDYDTEVEALRLRADSYGQLSKYDDAIRELHKIISIFPNDFLGHFLLGIFNFRISNFNESVKHYEVADKISPNHPTILSDLPIARKKLEEASKN
jgi:tetratricopeptide (TPR) repeat protein